MSILISFVLIPLASFVVFFFVGVYFVGPTVHRWKRRAQNTPDKATGSRRRL